jgi:D-3-phosphoglycerate dehydrogenase
MNPPSPAADPVEALILDLLEWIGPGPRPYAEVIEAWRTSCPRLPVWEEANARGWIEHRHTPGQPAQVLLSAQGLQQLRRRQTCSTMPPHALQAADQRTRRPT